MNLEKVYAEIASRMSPENAARFILAVSGGAAPVPASQQAAPVKKEKTIREPEAWTLQIPGSSRCERVRNWALAQNWSLMVVNDTTIENLARAFGVAPATIRKQVSESGAALPASALKALNNPWATCKK